MRVSEQADTLMGEKDTLVSPIDALVSSIEILPMAEERHNKQTFVGISGGEMGVDNISFLNQFLMTALSTDAPVGGFEIERAHKICAHCPRPNKRPRTIIAAFLRHQVRQQILPVTRE